MMGDESLEIRTFREKMLFYTTAFFILLGTFSMFAFLFLVPFVIEPAFTTIFMQFEEVPALCQTYDMEVFHGAKNCSWSSCREGCTKDIYTCTQIRVNYRLNLYNFTDEFNFTEYHINLKEAEREIPPVKRTDRYERAVKEYGYDVIGDGRDVNAPNFGDHLDYNAVYGFGSNFLEYENVNNAPVINTERRPFDEIPELNEGLMTNTSLFFYIGARLFPNVKGCGYPPMLNCTIWLKRYTRIGNKFPCYYSKVDPSLVISDLDYWQNTLNLVYSMAIPIPSFFISVIYLTYAYFKIYNEDEESAPLDKNAEDIDIDDETVDDSEVAVLPDNAAGNQAINVHKSGTMYRGMLPNGSIPASISQGLSMANSVQPQITETLGSQITPSSEINSFGHQIKVKMADEISRYSMDNNLISNSNSLHGNLSKTMTTTISTPPGPTAAV